MIYLQTLLVPALVFFSFLGAGHLAVRTTGMGADLSAAERWLLAMPAGALAVAFVVWAVGSVCYEAATMAAIMPSFVVLSLRMVWRARADIRLPGCGISLAGKALTAAAGVILAVAVIGCFAPPADHDTIRYHLMLPRRDLEWGRISAVYGWSVYEFLPPLGAMTNRLAYALGGAGAVMMMNVGWQVVCGAGTALLARRLGAAPLFCGLAFLLVIGQRVSINLSAVASVDFALAAAAAATAVAAFAFARKPGMAEALLLGLIGGAMVNSKPHGLVMFAAVVVVLAVATFRAPGAIKAISVASGLSALLLAPWLLRNFLVTGNPVFPAAHNKFGAGNIDIFTDYVAQFHAVDSLMDALLLPWNLFVHQGAFDGLQFGMPVFLILAPFGFFRLGRGRSAAAAAILALYLAAWIAVMPHLIRFLLPLFPLMAAVSAVGAESLFAAGRRLGARGLVPLAAVGVILVIGQALFLGSTAARRLPPALGLESEVAYLSSGPFAWFTHYRSCSWVLARLAPGERYLGLFNNPSYHCPPARAFPQLLPGDGGAAYTKQGPAEVPAWWLAERLAACRVRYVIVSRSLEKDNQPLVFAKHRYDRLIQDAAAGLKPVFTLNTENIYDGTEIARALAAKAKPPEAESRFAAPEMKVCDFRG
jgi:hypothetical protein